MNVGIIFTFFLLLMGKLSNSQNTSHYLGYKSVLCPIGGSENNTINQHWVRIRVSKTSKIGKRKILLLLILAGDVEMNPGPKRITTTTILKKNVTKPCSIENKQLLKELTKITPKDYQGKEYCRKCARPVQENHKAILCDKCTRWIHLRCSDCPPALYKKYQDQRTFNWICNCCRERDEVNNTFEIFNRSVALKEEDLPATLQEIKIKKTEKLILHYNCRSVVNKIDELHDIIIRKKPTMVLLTETWLNETHPKNILHVEGYKTIRKDRSQYILQQYGKEGGGGLAILYQEHMKIKLHNELNTEKDESLWFSTKLNRVTEMFCLMYRPHWLEVLTDEVNETLEETIIKATSINTNITLIGDINYNLLENSTKIEQVKGIFETLGMKQLIQKPTRLEGLTPSLLDHIWITGTSEENIVGSGTVEGISDHTGIYFKVNSREGKTEKTVTCRSYKEYSTERLQEEFEVNLNTSEYSKMIEERNLNEATSLFVEALQKAANSVAPIKTFKRKEDNKYIPWFTNELRELIQKRNNVLKLYYLYREHADKTNLKRLRNEINHMKKSLKRNYYSKKIEEYKGKPKDIWKIFKEVTGSTTVKENIEPEDMNQEKADNFNTYFATVGKMFQEKLGLKPKTTEIKDQETGFKFKEEDEKGIEKLIDRIRSDVATGYCTISARILKDAKPVVVKPLTELVNLSYKTSTYPSAMKPAVVKSIFKNKGTEEDPQNYRPLSILSVISKVFERSAANQIVEYMEHENLFYSDQHAYRKYHSTTTCLTQVTDYAYKEMDKGNIIGIAALDLSKAFDTIDHDLLIRKTMDMKFDAQVVHWIKSYLQDRSQQTKFTNYISKKETVQAGVPQGSILGPILFILFTHDLHRNINSPHTHVFSYADDTQLVTAGRNYNEVKQNLEEAIRKAKEWYKTNLLHINAGKTEILVIGKPKKLQHLGKLSNIIINEGEERKEIEVKENIKILGIYIDNHLSWSKQINDVKRKAYCATKNILRIKDLLPTQAKRKLYDSMITPHFNYCDTLWDGCLKSKSTELQKIQNLAVKAISNSRTQTSSSKILKELRLLPLSEKREVHMAVMAHKTLHGRAPLPQVQQFLKCLPQHEHNTRAATQATFMYQKHRHSKIETSSIYRAMKIWNNIPIKLRNITNQNTFKNSFQEFKKQNQDYTRI